MDTPNICPAFLLRLLQHVCNVLRVFSRSHVRFGFLHSLLTLLVAVTKPFCLIVLREEGGKRRLCI